MRTLVLALPLALLSFSCSTFTWQGQGAGVSKEQHERGIKSADELANEYETATFWRKVRQRRDGLVNAYSRDLSHILDTIDRNVFNYSSTDPYVNHPTDDTWLGETLGFGFDLGVGGTPIGDVMMGEGVLAK